jgi:hypothetical protein
VGPFPTSGPIAARPLWMALRAAAGTRIKIPGLMAASVPVVSTAREAEGLAIVSNTHFLLASTAEGLRDVVIAPSRDSAKAARLSSERRAPVRPRSLAQ